MAEIARDKLWKELTDAEKIQRLRQVVRNQAGDLERLRLQVNHLLSHSHTAAGALVAPIRSDAFDETLPQIHLFDDSEEVWF